MQYRKVLKISEIKPRQENLAPTPTLGTQRRIRTAGEMPTEQTQGRIPTPHSPISVSGIGTRRLKGGVLS